MTLSANSSFIFSSPVIVNGSYNVTVATQPAGEVCTVSNGSGAGVTANISDVTVTCSTDTYSISGSVSGLAAGAQLVLKDNGADALAITANGLFTFVTPAAYDSSYAVTVSAQPPGATCTVSNGTGAGITSNISNVSVTCASNTFAVGGTVSGLAGGEQVTLDDNGGDALTLTANGIFTFATPVADQGSYNITVGTQPTGQTCTVAAGSGTHVTNTIADIALTCSSDTYGVGGTVSGLGGGVQITLNDNGADPLTLTVNGPFTFATPVVYGGAYDVTIGTQPLGQTCVVSNGSGTGVTANVINVGISCSTNPVSFTVPGTYIWTVPSGVNSIQIAATGGGGGGGGDYGTNPSQPGGAGAVVTSTLSVTAGQVLNLVVGGGGASGTSGPSSGGGYYCGAGGGGGGSTTVDAGAAGQMIAGGGGAGGGCNNATQGGSGGGSGGDNGGSIRGGAGGSGAGTGTGAADTNGDLSGGGGGGYGGGGSGSDGTGGGAGGSTGPTGTTYAPASNGGASAAAAGGDGSIVITVQ